MKKTSQELAWKKKAKNPE